MHIAVRSAIVCMYLVTIFNRHSIGPHRTNTHTHTQRRLSICGKSPFGNINCNHRERCGLRCFASFASLISSINQNSINISAYWMELTVSERCTNEWINEWNYARRDFTSFNDRLSSTVSRPNNAHEKRGKKTKTLNTKPFTCDLKTSSKSRAHARRHRTYTRYDAIDSNAFTFTCRGIGCLAVPRKVFFFASASASASQPAIHLPIYQSIESMFGRWKQTMSIITAARAVPRAHTLLILPVKVFRSCQKSTQYPRRTNACARARSTQPSNGLKKKNPKLGKMNLYLLVRSSRSLRSAICSLFAAFYSW